MAFFWWEDLSGKDNKWFEIGSFQGTGIKSLSSLSSRQLERSSTWQRLTWILHQQQFAERPQTVWAHTRPHQSPRSFTFLFWFSHVENILHKQTYLGPPPHQTRPLSQLSFSLLVQPSRKFHAQVDISGPTTSPNSAFFAVVLFYFSSAM